LVVARSESIVIVEARRAWAVRLAALVIVMGVAAAVWITYLAYTAAFTPVDTITVTAERAGLVMDRDAKVKYLGVQVGKVTAIDYDGRPTSIPTLPRRPTTIQGPRSYSCHPASHPDQVRR
jgi:phospholipid/cholesterol/gamma-HCH transport system substrate-binding protein